MLPEQQNRLIVVLVRARNPSNIGAVARAMHDFGFAHLRIVNDYPVPLAAAQAAEKAAVHASSVLEAATEAPTLAAAIADCTLVLGTTAVGDRVLEHPLHTLAEAAVLIQSTLQRNSAATIALLFGSEKTGLSNEELSHCHALLTIPMNTRTPHSEPARHLSMNLGQAAAVCLYVIAQTNFSATHSLSFRSETEESASPPGTPNPASEMLERTDHQPTSGELERLTTLLADVLAQSGYTRRHPANTREATLRRLVLRMANSPDDAAVWSGILRQFLHALKSDRESP